MATLDGLHPVLMRPRVEALLADPVAVRNGLFLVSGFRSVEYQTRLWIDAVRKYGSEEAADNWVARPGTSRHGPTSWQKLYALGYTRDEVQGINGGVAVDLGVRGVRSVQGQWPAAVNAWVEPLVAKHGLGSPLSWEDWHHEPVKGWTGRKEDDLTPKQDQMLRELYETMVSGKRDGIVSTNVKTIRNHTTKIARKLGLTVS